MTELTHDIHNQIYNSVVEQLVKEIEQHNDALILSFLPKIEDPTLKELYKKHFNILTQHAGQITTEL